MTETPAQAALREAMPRLVAARAEAGYAPPPPATPTTPERGPCPHEGEVLEYCTSNCSREKKHVRECLYEGHDFDRCIRGPSGKAEVKSCSTCNHHPDARPPGII